jgi:small subunit ribosomal protein S15
MAVSSVEKQAIFAKYGRDESDTGSTPAQIALFTRRIEELSAHLKANKKDYATLRALQKLVGKRRSLLKYYRRKDVEAYRQLTADLGIRR